MAAHYVESDLTVHCEAAFGDLKMLCGRYRTEVDPKMKETAASITCADCIEVIDFCRKIRPGEVCSPFQRRQR